MRALLLFLLVTIPLAASAKDEVYKWVDDKGVVHYTDKPPSQNAEPAKLPPLQTYKGGTTPDLHKFDKGGAPGAAPASAGGPQLQLVTPGSEETFHGGERTVPVAVVVTPDLEPGQRIVFMLDGKPTAPTTDTSYAFTEVERGAHVASAKLVDEAGNEVSRSNEVTFYMKPPIAPEKKKKP